VGINRKLILEAESAETSEMVNEITLDQIRKAMRNHTEHGGHHFTTPTSSKRVQMAMNSEATDPRKRQARSLDFNGHTGIVKE
jgi:hypothetical protein